MSGKASLGDLEERIGHHFTRPDLLKRALTHASAIGDERRGDPLNTYERLEFLGDRVLGLVIADLLIEEYPQAPEGELSRRLARLVNRDTCAEVAEEMHLAEHYRVGESLARATERTARSILADTCESVIGAVFRDAGLDAAKVIIHRFWIKRLRTMQGPLRDAKTELQEWAHRNGHGTPRYQESGRRGPDHAPEFSVKVLIEGAEGAEGQGPSKREAEHAAASAILRREGVWL
ncbi:ribonuclease-3 [Rhodopseudomonas julia]|uniref:Ribonuclease 3 n=1 Tax=Rhodopseudomonas julia TaxID=200617 RepID=A0ABU0C7I4_9BRAD|nr:ribonuclease III [Rhodopseudomonas julia]MDQ0326487.1 ribonuclease-3 [Rhodopseudomonas julia]